jgi:hypothetical protein
VPCVAPPWTMGNGNEPAPVVGLRAFACLPPPSQDQFLDPVAFLSWARELRRGILQPVRRWDLGISVAERGGRTNSNVKGRARDVIALG